MRYLFGDSTESSLDINYLGFLRDAIDFGVALLQADAGMAKAREVRSARELEAAEQMESIEELGRLAIGPINAASGGDPLLSRTAAAIAAAIDDVIRRDAGKVRAALQGELDVLDADYQKMRDRTRAALGVLLAAHDLPGATETLSVRWNGAMHEARLQQKVGFGVEALVALDIPAGSLFAQDLKVERFADGAELHAPETAGWLKKEVKRVPHKIGRHHVTHVIVEKSGVTMRLRSAPESGATGFDIVVPRTGDPKIERIGGKEADGSFAIDDRDLVGVRAMATKLETAVEALRGQRGALVEATLDGKPLATLERPAEIVERLVEAMAPVVHEIVRHSLSPRELVLKRLLGNDRREEIFLSRAELAQKLEPLPFELRRTFAPLGLFDELAAPVPAPAPPPPPPPPPPAPEPERAITVEPENVIEAELSPPEPPPPDIAHDEDDEPEVSVTVEPAARPVRPTLPPLASVATLPTLPGTRPGRRTMPPPPPRAPSPPTHATIESALQDLEDSEPTELHTGAPRPGTEPL